MDYFAYQVNKRWYWLYWVIMVAWNSALLLSYILAQFSTQLMHYTMLLNIDSVAAIIAGISVTYLLIFFWIVKKYSLPYATLAGSMLLFLSLLNGLTGDVGTAASYLYIIVWLMSTFFAGLYGSPFLLGFVFLTFVHFLIQTDFNIAAVSKPAWILLLADLAVASCSYLFWRRRFVSIQEEQFDQLSGELKSNQKQSEILIQSIADGVIVTNTEGKITLINPAASAMTEWPIAEAVGVDAQLVAKLSLEGGQPIEATENPFITVLKQEKHSSQTLLLTGRDGKTQIISLVISPVTEPGKDQLVGAVAVMRDISEERTAEKQRADFISTASHEMRTPVAAIEGYLALALNEKVSTIDSRARGYLEKAHISTQHLGKLFQDLLTSSKAEDGRLSNHPTVVEMGVFLQQLTDDLKFAAEKKGLFVDFLIGASNEAIDATNKDTVNTHVLKPLYYVMADADRMREVVTNLFDNACKYTEQGKISIGLTGDNDVVQMYVRDTGSGIPADDVPHLFQKFYRVDNSATRTIGGTGLGLFICRKIVELYKGRIWVESEMGKGSTFFINLPRLSTQRATTLQQAEAAKPAELSNSGAVAKS
ncbi:MAG: sensor histidine kinase [Candidatus Saccharibacteria bacterium]